MIQRGRCALAVALGLTAACHHVRAEPSRVAQPEPALAFADPTPPPSSVDPDAPPLVAPAQARTTKDGVALLVLEHGEGPQPRSGDELELRYRVWDETGRRVGASRPDRTERMSLAWLPSGWAQAMVELHEGDHARIWVPAALAYPDHPDAPQGALVIDVELVAVHSPERPDPNALPLSEPPDNALRTPGGLAFVVISAGTGTRHPTPQSRVTVHYEGWTTDGNRFDSSYERGRPTTFPLTAVIEGWQLAVPLMVEGEKTRFWIPADLAYGSSPGKPQGMLIFDIELLSIDD